MEDAGSLLPELKLQVDDDFDFDINGIVWYNGIVGYNGLGTGQNV